MFRENREIECPIPFEAEVTPGKLRFHRVTVADAQSISDLVCRVTSQHIGPGLSPAGLEILLASMDTTSTRKRLSDGWPSFVAISNQVIAGVVTIKPPHHLYHLFVESGFHRQGIGRQLFELAESHVLDSTGGHIQTVNASLNAIHVYERFGFATSGDVMDKEGVLFQPMVRR